MEISLHMVLMYAKALNDKGVTKLKTMLEEYCHSIMITVGESVNIMDKCHKMTMREFSAHMRGDYYYNESGDKIMIKVKCRRGITKPTDSANGNNNSDNSDNSGDGVNEYKQLIPFECPAPKYVNNERGSLFNMGHLGDKLRGSVAPTAGSNSDSSEKKKETEAPTKSSN